MRHPELPAEAASAPATTRCIPTSPWQWTLMILPKPATFHDPTQPQRTGWMPTSRHK